MRDTDKKYLVSVLMPVYNASAYVKESIDSILRQTYANIEVLICDDCSTDNSLEIIRSFNDSRIKVFANQANQGYLKTINALARRAQGYYFSFQDADDVSHPRRIDVQVNELGNHPSMGFVGTNYAIINTKGQEVLRKNVESNSDTLKRLLENGNPFQKPSIVFKREVYDAIGMYREEFLQLGNISEDYDWILRASELFEMGNVNYEEPLYLYRAVPTAMTKKIISVEQFFGHEVARRLFNERKTMGKDSIESGDLALIHAFINELKKPYQLHRSLFHHKMAESLMYTGLHSQAIKHAFLSIFKEPLRVANYRLLQYCIRKTIFGF